MCIRDSLLPAVARLGHPVRIRGPGDWHVRAPHDQVARVPPVPRLGHVGLVASPQVFGDQTDVPESGDWWDAGYLIMWGSNVPVTRTPDAHWMTEARYRGQKVIAVAPDYADNVKFADEWLPAKPGTDGALAM